MGYPRRKLECCRYTCVSSDVAGKVKTIATSLETSLCLLRHMQGTLGAAGLERAIDRFMHASPGRNGPPVFGVYAEDEGQPRVVAIGTLHICLPASSRRLLKSRWAAPSGRIHNSVSIVLVCFEFETHVFMGTTGSLVMRSLMVSTQFLRQNMFSPGLPTHALVVQMCGLRLPKNFILAVMVGLRV